MKTETGRGESGFSLIELMTAMAITLIVSGAIYGLMAQGQSSFKREPQLTDRQQNARIAMDMIERDLANAGRGMPGVSQVFTDGLDGAGPNGLDATRTVEVTDELEMIMANAGCASQLFCDALPAGQPATTGTAGTYVTRESTVLNTCLNAGGLVMLANARLFSLHVGSAAAAGNCTGAAGANGQLVLSDPVAGYGNAWGAGYDTKTTLYPAQVVRYRVTDAAADPQGIQDLQRSDSIDAAGVRNWQIIARGIENLQVRYMRFDNAWDDTPGPVPACPDTGCTIAEFNTLITNVRVTLQARTIDPTMTGNVGDHAVRGQLTTIVSPRAAATALAAGVAVTNYN